MKSQRYRSKLFPRDLPRRWEERRMLTRRGITYNRSPAILIYTTKLTLDTVAGTPRQPFRGGRIVGIWCKVVTAPTSTLTCDVLLNGQSIFQLMPKPTIPSGSTKSNRAIPDRTFFVRDDVMKIQLTATGSAGGPMVVEIEYLPGGF